MKDVISIPAGGTQALIKKYLIHAHPHPRSYKESKYMTFRRNGGFMEALYRVQQEFVLKHGDPDIEKKVDFLESEVKNRLLGYIYERRNKFGFEKKEEFKFYVLKVEKELDHLPSPKETLQGHTYYTFDEITSGKRIICRESDKSCI
ncbi:hypothetical protein [Bacillus sp. EAC]|uniref:hypothetical protein n=1 Tax=Bacillus sp. EAC TaxID=1978338 RepID=UPI000B42EE16|nr:hypothetical protein [Bacillus sp. EAC]